VTQKRPHPGRRLLAATVLLGLVLSQPGHALGYFAAYGWRSLAIQSHGVHGYFPTAIHFSVGLLVTVLLATASLLGLGRLALGSALGLKRERAASPLELIFVLAVVQFNVYFLQELTEALAAHQFLGGAWLLTTLWIGLIGQLPVALLAALLLAWCSVRLHAAITALRWALAAIRCSPPLAANDAPPVSSPRAADLAKTFPAAFRKRGPPLPRPSLAF
jgi:hypothetical protein